MHNVNSWKILTIKNRIWKRHVCIWKIFLAQSLIKFCRIKLWSFTAIKTRNIWISITPAYRFQKITIDLKFCYNSYVLWHVGLVSLTCGFNGDAVVWLNGFLVVEIWVIIICRVSFLPVFPPGTIGSSGFTSEDVSIFLSEVGKVAGSGSTSDDRSISPGKISLTSGSLGFWSSAVMIESGFTTAHVFRSRMFLGICHCMPVPAYGLPWKPGKTGSPFKSWIWEWSPNGCECWNKSPFRSRWKCGTPLPSGTLGTVHVVVGPVSWKLCMGHVWGYQILISEVTGGK